jgi:MFS family permease
MIPSLLKTEGLSLAAAGAFGLALTLGMVFTLFMWGVAADRFGERAVISVGLGLASALAMLSSFASGTLALGVMLFFVGAASAATDSASGRHCHGRTCCAADRGTVGRWRSDACRRVAHCLHHVVVCVRDPRSRTHDSPLGVGLSASWAGAVIAAAQLSGAFGRILIGSVSDRVGSRVTVVRWVSLGSLAAMLCLAGLGVLQWPIAAAVAYVCATVVSVADNGLNAIAVAEAAGSGWTGRVFGVHNTLLFATSFGVGPGVGALIAAIGYPLTFAARAATPLAARLLLPRQDKVPQTRA